MKNLFPCCEFGDLEENGSYDCPRDQYHKTGQDYVKMGLDKKKIKIIITIIKSNVNTPLILSYYFITSLIKYLHAPCYRQEYWKTR